MLGATYIHKWDSYTVYLILVVRVEVGFSAIILWLEHTVHNLWCAPYIVIVPFGSVYYVLCSAHLFSFCCRTCCSRIFVRSFLFSISWHVFTVTRRARVHLHTTWINSSLMVLAWYDWFTKSYTKFQSMWWRNSPHKCHTVVEIDTQ